MLSKASIEGKRVRIAYRLENVRLYGKSNRERREIVTFRLKPSTIELNEWLAKKGWAPPGNCNGGRAMDFYIKRFYWLIQKPNRWPDKRRSTLSVLMELLEIAKSGTSPWFLDVDLIEHPNKCRMIDYLASFWYEYEGGKKRTF